LTSRATATSAVADLTSALVAIDARNPWLIDGGPGEGAIAAEVTRWSSRLPRVEVTVDDVEAGRPNVIVRLPGTGGGPTLCLNAHLDTVGDAAWPDRSMRPLVDGDRLVGLGVADDKGHGAALLLTLESLASRPIPLRGDILAAFVMDEEATSLGTQALVDRWPMEAAIVLEPFGLGKAIVSHQGFGWLDITVRGRAAHGSAPDAGIDAISRMARVIGSLDALGRRWAADPDPRNGATVYHASTVSGGSDYATYPGSAILGIEIGTQPGETIADRVADIEAILAELRREMPDLDADVRVRLARDPFEAAGHERLLEAVDRATIEILGRPSEPAGENAWMDAALIQAAGIPTIVLGASGGNLHAPDEWVSLPELAALTDLLIATCVGFCG
jgi:acetylornithine deacetylase/succinyl-diaminopimelate desuccinylase-like protein